MTLRHPATGEVIKLVAPPPEALLTSGEERSA